MKARYRSLLSLAIVMVSLVGIVQVVSAQSLSAASVLGMPAKFPILFGTTGACDNVVQGGPCTQTSTLVLVNANTGKLIKKIGPVGYTVNGLAWDPTSGKLYASTAIGDQKFHGLITVNPFTGRGKPVNPSVDNFGLPGDPSPIHSIAVDSFGHMVAWYDEFPPPDTYVQIDQRTGIATEFAGTGINTSQNGVAFGEFNLLWNIDAPRLQPDGSIAQTAYVLNPFNGRKFSSILLSPPTPAALGDFRPGTNLYYGLNFDNSSPAPRPAFIEVVDPLAGSVTELAQTVDDLHTLAFVRGPW